MKKVFAFSLYLFLSVSCLFLLSKSTFAAEFVLRGSASEVSKGGEVAVHIFLNTGNEEINAVEGAVLFPESLQAKEVRDGNSLVTFWIQRPTIEAKNSNRVQFSGLTPGGVSVTNGYLFTIIFQASTLNEDAVATIVLDKTRALLNDGAGTPTAVSVKPFTVFFNAAAASTPTVSGVTDTEPPEPFTPVVGRDAAINNGEWFVVFLAQDTGSGIDHYEVQESNKEKINQGNWQRATSPYVLSDQSLGSFIHVKAVDRAGNERIAIVPPKNKGLYAKYLFWCILIGVVVMLSGFIVWKKRRITPTS